MSSCCSTWNPSPLQHSMVLIWTFLHFSLQRLSFESFATSAFNFRIWTLQHFSLWSSHLIWFASPCPQRRFRQSCLLDLREWWNEPFWKWLWGRHMWGCHRVKFIRHMYKFEAWRSSRTCFPPKSSKVWRLQTSKPKSRPRLRTNATRSPLL